MSVVTKDLDHVSPVLALRFFFAMQVQHSLLQLVNQQLVEFYLQILVFTRIELTTFSLLVDVRGYLLILDHSGDEAVVPLGFVSSQG